MYIICVVAILAFIWSKIDKTSSINDFEDYDSWVLISVIPNLEDVSVCVETPNGNRRFIYHKNIWTDVDTNECCSVDEVCTLTDLLCEREDDEQCNSKLWKS